MSLWGYDGSMIGKCTYVCERKRRDGCQISVKLRAPLSDVDNVRDLHSLLSASSEAPSVFLSETKTRLREEVQIVLPADFKKLNLVELGLNARHGWPDAIAKLSAIIKRKSEVDGKAIELDFRASRCCELICNIHSSYTSIHLLSKRAVTQFVKAKVGVVGTGSRITSVVSF
jgi:hypothetical protein